MENNKHDVGSPSSFTTSDLLRPKEDSSSPPHPQPQPPVSSSSGIFSSIFPPPSAVLGKNSSTSELMESLQKQSSESQKWSLESPDDMTNREGTRDSKSNMERSSTFQERLEPCPLSSSLHYGAQEDMYVKSSSSSQTVGSYPKIKKSEGEDDSNGSGSHSASRGNWWQGSLYY